MEHRKKLHTLFSHEHKVITVDIPIGKEIADAYTRLLTAGALRKSDRIGAPGSLSTIGIPQIPMMIVRSAEPDAVGL